MDMEQEYSLRKFEAEVARLKSGALISTDRFQAENKESNSQKNTATRALRLRERLVPLSFVAISGLALALFGTYVAAEEAHKDIPAPRSDSTTIFNDSTNPFLVEQQNLDAISPTPTSTPDPCLQLDPQPGHPNLQRSCE